MSTTALLRAVCTAAAPIANLCLVMQLQPSDRLIITIDGPAGSGKTTVAQRLASRLGLAVLDTGAMYRAVAAAVLDRGLDPTDEDRAADLAEQLTLHFDWRSDPPRLHVDGQDVHDRLRDADVTTAVSPIAANRRIRQLLVEAQRHVAAEHPRLVTEGRDQGSVVFPDATVKFYLDGEPTVRAQRRADQLRQAGRQVDQEQILTKIVARDQCDRGRVDGPLICADDAVRIDTSNMTVDQVVAVLIEQISQRSAGLGDAPGTGP